MPIVELRGNVDLRKAMGRFTPDLEKNLRKDLKTALKPVVSKAKGFAPSVSPMSGWAARSFSEGRFPTYNRSTVVNGITLTVGAGRQNKNGFTSMAAIINKSAIGTIFETSGRKNPKGQPWVGPKAKGAGKGVSRSSNKKAGDEFIYQLGPIVNSPKGNGRLIYRAWAGSQGVAEGAAMKAISESTKEFYAYARSNTLSRGI